MMDKSNIEKDVKLYKLAQQYVKDAEENAEKYPTSNEILVVIVEPRKKPYKKVISNDLKIWNEIVEGYIEEKFIGNYDGLRIGLIMNEEGKLLNLPVNRRVVGLDTLVGTFFIIGFNLQGDAVSLSNDFADRFIKLFSPLEVYL